MNHQHSYLKKKNKQQQKMPFVSDSPRKQKIPTSKIQLHSEILALLPGSAEAFVLPRTGQDGAALLAD